MGLAQPVVVNIELSGELSLTDSSYPRLFDGRGSGGPIAALEEDAKPDGAGGAKAECDQPEYEHLAVVVDLDRDRFDFLVLLALLLVE